MSTAAGSGQEFILPARLETSLRYLDAPNRLRSGLVQVELNRDMSVCWLKIDSGRSDSVDADGSAKHASVQLKMLRNKGMVSLVEQLAILPVISRLHSPGEQLLKGLRGYQLCCRFCFFRSVRRSKLSQLPRSPETRGPS